MQKKSNFMTDYIEITKLLLFTREKKIVIMYLLNLFRRTIMNYYINPTVLTTVFTVPVSVVDNHFKFAKPEYIKVLLYIMRNMSVDLNESDIADFCAISEFCVKEALLYWADAGILLPKDSTLAKEDKPKESAIVKNEKPTRLDVAKRGDDPKVRYLLSQTQLKLGRILKSNETQTLVWLYDDQGLDVSLILLIVQYAVSHKKANIRFIESTAVSWIEKGICDISDADAELKKMAVSEQAWSIVADAFGLERRKPSKKETELSYLWINDWKFTKEMLEKAYEECVNAKSKFSFAYTAKILENWHEKGYQTPNDIESVTADTNDSFAAYSMEEFEKMLKSKD